MEAILSNNDALKFNDDAFKHLKSFKKTIEELRKDQPDIYENLWELPPATKWLGSLLLKEELRSLEGEALLKALGNKDNWSEKASKESLSLDWLMDGKLLDCLSNKSLNRQEMRDRISELKNKKEISSVDIRRSIIEIFCWGGMNFRNARIALSCSYLSKYEDICRGLLSDNTSPADTISPADAYKKFYDAYRLGQITYIGPAYYTKLIFFFGDQTGVIMDQWTARSINKLFEEKPPIVKLTNKKSENKQSVPPSNTSENYGKFLEKCECLRKKLDVKTLSEAEELIFSCGDSDPKVKKEHRDTNRRICSAWRRYIKEDKKILQES